MSGEQGSKFSANWLNSAIFGLILIISEINVNLLRKEIGGGGEGGPENDFLVVLD